MQKWYLESVPGNEIEFWDKHWERTNIIEQIQNVFDDPNYRIIKRVFSKDDLLLEAGCGLGRFVIPLKEEGFSILGIDYSSDSINEIKAFNTKYDVKVGNILKIDYPNGMFDGYISLGVLEHFIEGPQKALEEASRVLKTNGIILVSVPYMNIIRRMKIVFSWALSKNNRFFKGTLENPKNFYAYVFTKFEFLQELEKANFELYEVIPICIPFGVFLEFPILEKVKTLRAVVSIIVLKICARIKPLSWSLAHMIMFVAKKK